MGPEASPPDPHAPKALAQAQSRGARRPVVPVEGLPEKARRGLDIDVFDEMLDVASIIAFKSFLGEAGSAVPTDVYQTLNDVFCWIRENIFSVFIIPVWLPRPTSSRESLRAGPRSLPRVQERLGLRSRLRRLPHPAEEPRRAG